MSIDNFENKNLLAAILLDRVVLISQSHYFKKMNPVEIKTKSVSLLQPLLAGFVSFEK
jgi:hypothetical protein